MSPASVRMPNPPSMPFAIDYATIPVRDGSRFIPKMLEWRWACECSALFMLAGVLWWPLFLLAAIATLTCVIMALIYMTLAAALSGGVYYAIRQLGLAILLCPIFLLGIWIVPPLVKSDLANWREEGQVEQLVGTPLS